MTERVDVIDPDAGTVVSVTTRDRVRAENLWHRSVFVVVARTDGTVVTHRRADWKDVWPDRWDCSFGGVVSAGETTHEAAERELAEEAGIVGVPLEHLGRGRYADDRVREVGEVYLARWDGPVVPTDGEVAEVGGVALSGLDAWLERHDVVPDAVTIVVPLLAGVTA